MSDGKTRKIVSDDIVVGAVLRMPYSDGAVPPFGDIVVIGIHAQDNLDHKHVFDNMTEAINFVRKEKASYDYDHMVIIELARPSLYANSIGLCFGWLTGVEHYRVNPKSILENYVLITMSTGKSAIYKK